MKILIIEDDPMVAMIHQEYFKRLTVKHNIIHVQSLSEAEKYLEKNVPEFILLDNYLPDGQGVEFSEKIKQIPTIMITAANDVVTVKKALSNGIVDYLVKPFTFERFSQAIARVQDFVYLSSKEQVSQDVIDKYLSTDSEVREQIDLPKGLSKITLKKIIEILMGYTSFTTQQIADETNISRITIRKYLNYLVEVGGLLEDADYLTFGRPVSVFKIASEKVLKSLIL